MIILNNIFYLTQHVQNVNTLVYNQYKINVFLFCHTKFLKPRVRFTLGAHINLD